MVKDLSYKFATKLVRGLAKNLRLPPCNCYMHNIYRKSLEYCSIIHIEEKKFQNYGDGIDFSAETTNFQILWILWLWRRTISQIKCSSPNTLRPHCSR